MNFCLRIGETTTLMDPETGEPVTVRLDVGEEGRVVAIVEAVPEATVERTGSSDVDVVTSGRCWTLTRSPEGKRTAARPPVVSNLSPQERAQEQRAPIAWASFSPAARTWPCGPPKNCFAQPIL